jgi:NAD(P)H-hydrate epimerase
MVLLRALILEGYTESALSRVWINRLPSADERNPRSLAFFSLGKMGVPSFAWNAPGDFSDFDILIDGITGAGLSGPLRGAALEMAGGLNGRKGPLAVSIDVPSGCFDGWEPGMPMVKADAVLAIEPVKAALYCPAARPHCGAILPVKGIFPRTLLDGIEGPRLYGWKDASALIPPVPQAAYKYERGLVEIRAGSPGAAGAARIAARGAQAAGAGIVRLVVDPSIHPMLAAGAGGIMVAPDVPEPEADRFVPAAILLGPGWGRTPGRERLLERALQREEGGTPLVLDADAIALAGTRIFHGKTILTPHPGELAAWAGIPKEEVLSRPLPLLSRLAAERNAVILFKSHVLYAVSPDGRAAVVDGMMPELGSGGSGDLLAGFCAALAARAGVFEAAAAAAALLIESAACAQPRFTDPLELAGRASRIAGRAWLPGRGKTGRRGRKKR